MSQLQAPAGSQSYRQSTTGSQTTGSQAAATQATGGQATGNQTDTAQTTASQATGGQPATATGPVGQRFPTRSYLPDETRTTSIGLLNQCLADLTTVTMQLKSAHWNVKGIHFYQLHELFEELVADLEAHVDTVAERASALGGQALGTVQDVAQNCTIPALPRNAVDGAALLQALADRLARFDATIGQQIEVATAYEDPDTVDLLNEVSRDVSKALWFVEAHLQGPEGVRAPAEGQGQVQSGAASSGATAAGGMTGYRESAFGQQDTQGPSPDSQWETTGLQ